jgi:hypothetical protein
MKAIRFRTPEKWLFTLGAGLIVAAAVGGGLEVAGFEIPLVSSVPRQLVLGFFGIALSALSFLIPSERDKPTAARTEGEEPSPVQKARTRKLVTAMPSETVINRRTEVWVQICRATSFGFVESLPRYTASGEEIRKVDARSHPATVHFPVDNEKLDSTTVLVTISAPDFLVEEKQQRVNLSPTHDSGLIVFALTPHTTALMSRVLVSVSQRQREQTVVVGSASLPTRIGTLDSTTSNTWTVVEGSFGAEAIQGRAEEERSVHIGAGIVTGKRADSIDLDDPFATSGRDAGEKNSGPPSLSDTVIVTPSESPHAGVGHPAEPRTESLEPVASREPAPPAPAPPAPAPPAPVRARGWRASTLLSLSALALIVGGLLFIAWRVFF